MASKYGAAKSDPKQMVDAAQAAGGDPGSGYDPAMHQYWQRQAEENMNAVHQLKNGAPFQPSPSAPDRQALMKRMLEDAQHAQWQADYLAEQKLLQDKAKITELGGSTPDEVMSVFGGR